MLIKIDTEGNKDSIFQESVRTLQKIKPNVFFEKNVVIAERVQLFSFFKSHGLGPYVLTFTVIAAALCWAL